MRIVSTTKSGFALSWEIIQCVVVIVQNMRSRRKKLTPHNWGVIFSEKGKKTLLII